MNITFSLYLLNLNLLISIFSRWSRISVYIYTYLSIYKTYEISNNLMKNIDQPFNFSTWCHGGNCFIKPFFFFRSSCPLTPPPLSPQILSPLPLPPLPTFLTCYICQYDIPYLIPLHWLNGFIPCSCVQIRNWFDYRNHICIVSI